MKRNILIIYATNSGGTYIASRIIKRILEREHNVSLQRASETTPEKLSEFDIVILGSPSWTFGVKEGYPHESFIQLFHRIQDKKQTFNQKYFAVFSCGDSSYTYFGGAADYLKGFVLSTLKGKLLVEPLKIDRFYFNLEKNTALVERWSDKLLKALR
jgi:flavodoxin